MKQNFYISLGLGLCLFFITACLPTSQFGQSSTQPLISTFKIDASYPESDTSNSFNVFLRGSVPTNVKSIRFFNGTTCATQIGSGLSATFKGVIGIPVVFPLGSITSYNVSAKLIYSNNIESGCYENIFLYKRTGANALALVSAEPASPSRIPVEDSDPVVFQPLLKGVSSSDDIAYVRLYKNSNLCSTASLITPVDKTDSKLSINDFSGGINIDLEADSITSIYIKGFLDNEYSNREADSCHLLTTYTVDITAPNPPATITHRYFYPFQTSPSITWSAATDLGNAASGIKNYRYAIGLTDTPNETSVLGWTETTNTSFMLNSSFQENIKYFVKVRAIDRAGNESATAVSHGWTVKTNNTPALSIKSPESDNTIIANYITLSGTCVYGVTNPIRFQVSGGMNPIPDAACGINNQFSTLAQVISSVGNVRSITAIQNDGERDLAVTRTLIYAPLSAFGSTLAAGNQHTCTTKEGSLYCWGENAFTQLGIGDIAGPLFLPRRVSHSNINKPSYFFEQVGNGDWHSCGLSTDRIAYCWGNNFYWQLGNSSNFATETPIPTLEKPYTELPSNSPIPIKVNMSQVEGGTFKQISVGAFHSCGLSDLNKVYCWGSNTYSQIGNKYTPSNFVIPSADRPTLVSIPGNVTQISAGHSHNCALTSVGDIWCWGYNINRQLGNPSKTTDTSKDPVVVVPGGQMEAGEKFKYVSAGSLHTCAITTKDDIFCWGARDNGALGITPAVGNVSNPSIRINVTDSEGVVKFKSVSAGGTIWNLERTIDNPLEGDLAATEQKIEPHNQHTCAISLGGKVYCWGQNGNLQLGINNTSPPPQTGVPTEIVLSGNDQNINFTEVKTGFFHTCAKGIKNQQETTFCWGGNKHGKVGNGNDVDQASPTEIDSDDYSN